MDTKINTKINTKIKAMIPMGTLLNPWENKIPSTTEIQSLFDSHIVALYPLDETTGTVVNDLSANNCNAAYAGTFSLNQDGIGDTKSVNMLGTGRINLYSTALRDKINMKEGYISTWFKLNDNAYWNNSAAILYIYGDANNRFQIIINSVGSITAFYRAGGVSLTVGCDILDGTKWFNLGVGWSKSQNKLSIFINGQEAGTGTGITADFGVALPSHSYLFTDGYGGQFVNCCAQNILILDYFPTYEEIYKSVRPIGLVVLEGDSRSNTKKWIGKAIESSNENPKFGFNKHSQRSFATSGANTSDIIARAATTNAAIKFPALKSVLMVWIGVNDSALTDQQIFNNVKSYCLQAKANGYKKIILFTEIDAQDATRLANLWPTKYLSLNNLFKSDPSFYDLLADLGARPELQDALNLTYYLSDKIHLTQAGYDVVGEVVGAAFDILK